MVFAVPNGGKRHAGEARRLKEQGVLAGVPDLIVVSRWPTAIEMKQIGAKPSAAQTACHGEMIARGWRVVVGYGHEDARQKLMGLGY